MANSQSTIDFIMDQLSGMGGVVAKNMFGGTGFFKNDVMFGMLGSDVFRLRVSEESKSRYEAAGMTPFYSGKMKKGMPYWEVPADVLEDAGKLIIWASEAFDIAVKAKK